MICSCDTPTSAHSLMTSGSFRTVSSDSRSSSFEIPGWTPFASFSNESTLASVGLVNTAERTKASPVRVLIRDASTRRVGLIPDDLG